MAILYYLAGYLFTVMAAFMIINLLTKEGEGEDISCLAGLSKRSPFLAFAMTLAAVSLAGIPPWPDFRQIPAGQVRRHRGVWQHLLFCTAGHGCLWRGRFHLLLFWDRPDDFLGKEKADEPTPPPVTLGCRFVSCSGAAWRRCFTLACFRTSRSSGLKPPPRWSSSK